MIVPTIVMAIAALVAFILAYNQGQEVATGGVKNGLNLFLAVLPLLFFALLLAGLIQVLLPQEVISKWIGKESGFRGILLGCIAGGLSPGGPYVNFPIVAMLYRTGASIGTIVAFLTAWSLWAVARLPMEIGFVGVKITVARLLSTLIFPPLAGLIANLLFSKFV